MRANIKRLILKFLAEMDGIPMTSTALIDQVKIVFPQTTLTEIHQARAELETAGYISGNVNQAIGTVTWVLTDKGQHEAKQL